MDKSASELFDRRDPTVYRGQVEAHLTLAKRLLRLAQQQSSRKPNSQALAALSTRGGRASLHMG